MDLKQIQITGGAKDDYESIMKSGRKKRSTRKSRKDGTDGSPEKSGDLKKSNGPHQITKVGGSNGALISLAASHVPSSPNAPPPKPVLESTGANLAPAPTSAQKAGAAAPVKPKVILEPKKKESAEGKQLPKVHLEAPKSKQPVHTRKARKIRVSLNGLGKRITRHKKIQKEAKSVSIDQIKKTLIDAKLIKAESKAPESMLRQMYADYQTLKNKAL